MYVNHHNETEIGVSSTEREPADLAIQFTCYVLPYGALGFVSHVIAYYTIGCLWAQRSPLWPGRKVHYGWWSMFWAVVGMLPSTGTAGYTIARCKDNWQLMTIAMWQLNMALLNGLTGIDVARVAAASTEKKQKIYGWIVVYVPGLIAGMCGLMSLVVDHWHIGALAKLTIGFYTMLGIISILGFVFAIQRSWVGATDQFLIVGFAGVAFAAISFLILSVLFSDWALALMVHNITGMPTKEAEPFYWAYWVAKRMNMFCW